jgi:energy-coupling factor transport system substrate-specific component
MPEQKLKLKQKKSTKQKQGTIQSLSSKQKIGLIAIQKQLQLIKLKEWLLVIGFAGLAAFLRVPMQAVPSAEPLTFFAILAGWLFGRNKGFIVGASSLYISNFLVMGGQGPWTPFQALGFGIAGWVGGLLRKNASIFEIVTISVIGTLIFELIINSATPLMLGGASIFTAFALAIPFTLVHLVSNLLFAFGLKPAKKYIEEKGGFDEKDICTHILARHNISTKFNWLKKFRKQE